MHAQSESVSVTALRLMALAMCCAAAQPAPGQDAVSSSQDDSDGVCEDCGRTRPVKDVNLRFVLECYYLTTRSFANLD